MATETPDSFNAAFQAAAANLHLRAADILECVADAFVAVDHNWRILYANREACRINQKPLEDFVGKIHWEEWPAGIGTELEYHFRRAMDERLAGHFEYRYVTGPYDVWLETDVYPSENGINIFYRDITERKQAEQALRRSQQDLRLAIEAAQIGTFYCDYPLDKIVWNDTCQKHFFLTPGGEADFSLFYSLLHPDDRELTRQAIARALTERAAYDVEYRAQAPDGRTRWVNAIGRFHYDSAGQPIRFDGITLDISQRKAAAEELRRRAEREALISRITQALRASTDPEVIQETAARLLGAALGADRCFYVTYDLARDEAVVSQGWGRKDLPSVAGGYRASDFRALLSEVLPGQQTAIVSDVQAAFSPAVASAFLASQHRAALIVPFFDSAVLVAALYVTMADAPRAWTAEEAALVEQVATLTRTSLEAARVQQRERRIAEQLQEALLPALPAHIPGLAVGKFTRAALNEAQVGGDFYDIFPLDKELYAIVIGDVSGKGLAAAQQLALIRNSLRTILYLYRSPAEAVAQLNAIVSAHDLLVGFVTTWGGIYDAATGEITYASCGHEPGLVKRVGGLVQVLETTGPPLGVAQDAHYSEQTVTLSPGDSLLLYTDGISEAGPNRRELLGTNGLARLFAALSEDAEIQEQAETLVAEVSGFAGGVFRDDVAVLLARRQ